MGAQRFVLSECDVAVMRSESPAPVAGVGSAGPGGVFAGDVWFYFMMPL